MNSIPSFYLKCKNIKCIHHLISVEYCKFRYVNINELGVCEDLKLK